LVGREVSKLQKKTSNRHTAKMLSWLRDLVEPLSNISDLFIGLWGLEWGMRLLESEPEENSMNRTLLSFLVLCSVFLLWATSASQAETFISGTVITSDGMPG
jgi:hypothetical protein